MNEWPCLRWIKIIPPPKKTTKKKNIRNCKRSLHKTMSTLQDAKCSKNVEHKCLETLISLINMLIHVSHILLLGNIKAPEWERCTTPEMVNDM